MLAQNLNVEVPKNWIETGTDIFKLSQDAITNKPISQIWWSYLAIDTQMNSLIGNCGFKGEPIDGRVEIGYEVCKTFRNQGYGTEMVLELINIAFCSKTVNSILARTLYHINPSITVLKNCGFNFLKEVIAQDKEKLNEWILLKINYSRSSKAGRKLL